MTPARQRTLVLGLILIGILLVGFFGLRFFHAFREIRGHRPPPFPLADSQLVETDVELIRDWMTIGFISHTYRTPPKLLYKALDISPRGNEEKSIQQLNDEYFPNQPGYVLTTVKETIRANQPIRNALPPDTAVPSATAP